MKIGRWPRGWSSDGVCAQTHGYFRHGSNTFRELQQSVPALIEAESARAPVGEQAAVVACYRSAARGGGMNDDQLHFLAAVNVGGQHVAQLRIR